MVGQRIPGAWPPGRGGAQGCGGRWGQRPTVTPSGGWPRTCLPGDTGLEGPELFFSHTLLGIIALNKVNFYSEGLLRAFSVHWEDGKDGIRSVSQMYFITEPVFSRAF